MMCPAGSYLRKEKPGDIQLGGCLEATQPWVPLHAYLPTCIRYISSNYWLVIRMWRMAPKAASLLKQKSEGVGLGENARVRILGAMTFARAAESDVDPLTEAQPSLRRSTDAYT